MIVNFSTFLEHKISEKLFLKKGTILYHGSSSKFNTLSKGSDHLIWTTDDYTIARMYIPTGFTHHINLNSDNLYNDLKNMVEFPSKIHDKYQSIQNKFDNFFTIENQYKTILKTINELEKEIYKLTNEEEVEQKEDELLKIINDFEVVEREYNNLKKEIYVKNIYSNINSDIIDIIYNNYGYDKTDDRFIVKNGKLQKKEYSIGYIYELKLNKDVVLRDFRLEQDGMYNHTELKLFHRQKELGYDGVCIEDFAQSYHYGNYSHDAYGFFENNFDIINIIQDTHPTMDEIQKKTS